MIKRLNLLPILLLVLTLVSAPAPASGQFTVAAEAPVAGDVAVGALPTPTGSFAWVHGSGPTVDVGQTFLAPADFSLQGVTVRVTAETGIAGRLVALHILALGPDGDPATGTLVATSSAVLPAALSPDVTLYLTRRLLSPVSLEAGERYAFRLHFEGGGNVNDARARVHHGGDVYADGTAFQDSGGFVTALPGDLLFLLHGGPAAGALCEEDGLTLCLQDERFRLSASFSADGVLYRGAGAQRMTPDTGYFWFFEPDNVELVTKVLGGCPVNDHFWVFTAGLTHVEVHLEVTDTEMVPEQVQDYGNPLRTGFAPILDAAAFATCP